MGVAGAAAEERTILLTGIAGLVAGACSMAMGEWLSVNSARELYQGQIKTEAMELEQAPAEEVEEIILIYKDQFMPESVPHAFHAKMMDKQQTSLANLMRVDPGIHPQALDCLAWHPN